MPAPQPTLVADQLYFIAHDDRDGSARLHPRAVALGLAAALLGELVLIGRLAVHDGSVQVLNRHPPGDPVGHQILTWLYNQPQHHKVRTWLDFLAVTATDQIAQRLVTANYLEPVRQRRGLRLRTAYVPTNINVAAWQTVRLANLLSERRLMAPADAFLAGLVSATGLMRSVLWDDAGSTGRRYVPHVVAGLNPSLHLLVSFTEVGVGQVVLAPH